ncbi:unnamed protein product [Lactuca saligna]|uniref:Uncharacterized protein n=1 Tax=Lactuca saligna TaxID=75948 RepID=A0AA35YGT8_LACSI|nr:unnamed protein product [Lactuca saligna]
MTNTGLNESKGGRTTFATERRLHPSPTIDDDVRRRQIRSRSHTSCADLSQSHPLPTSSLTAHSRIISLSFHSGGQLQAGGDLLLLRASDLHLSLTHKRPEFKKAIPCRTLVYWRSITSYVLNEALEPQRCTEL